MTTVQSKKELTKKIEDFSVSMTKKEILTILQSRPTSELVKLMKIFLREKLKEEKIIN